MEDSIDKELKQIDSRDKAGPSINVHPDRKDSIINRGSVDNQH